MRDVVRAVLTAVMLSGCQQAQPVVIPEYRAPQPVTRYVAPPENKRQKIDDKLQTLHGQTNAMQELLKKRDQDDGRPR